MSDPDKTLGERLGDLSDAVKSKVNEGADRARAEQHDFAAETSDNPVDRLVEKGLSTVDRAKAEVHEADAERHSDNAQR